MKNRFNTLDVVAAVADLQHFVGMKLVNAYDINSKTYLFKLQRFEEKAFVLFESGTRVHATSHDWPKGRMPSAFSMKLRKHLRDRRLSSISQVGSDRVVDFSFGGGESTFHVIVELYDRGNVVLTDRDFLILNILRRRTDQETDTRLKVGEKYHPETARKWEDLRVPSIEEVRQLLDESSKQKGGGDLVRALFSVIPFGAPFTEHALRKFGIEKTKNVTPTDEVTVKTRAAIEWAVNNLLEIKDKPFQGYILCEGDATDENSPKIFKEFNPLAFLQYEGKPALTFGTFSEAVDEFFARQAEQKSAGKALHAEKEALKKLENVKKDQEARIVALEEEQAKCEACALRITSNQTMVDNILTVIVRCLANRMTWHAIEEMRTQAAAQGDAGAQALAAIDLKKNKITLRLADPFDEDDGTLEVMLDVSKNAYQNAQSYFEQCKAAADKQRRTEVASAKAIKSAQVKTAATIDQVRVKLDIEKHRKPLWFEKFLWFISSDRIVVIAGRDAKQNEMLAKKYLRPGDVYMHADIRGASSVVVRSREWLLEQGNSLDAFGEGRPTPPPKTLSEAATMALCYSNAWEAKVVVDVFWVFHDQVSRTAETGEFLPPGSFMIRGRKNFIKVSFFLVK